MNAAFCRDVVVVKRDDEIFEFKYLKTKNSPIYRDTNKEDGWRRMFAATFFLQEFQEKTATGSLTLSLIFPSTSIAPSPKSDPLTSTC
ncbi:hypothetical protein Trydic_g13323 [Trypoxylus dichotomus]